MQTEANKIEIDGLRVRSDQEYLDSILKEIKSLGVNEQYSLNIFNFMNEEEKIKKIFETVFVKQKPNLLKMELRNMKLFPNFFRLFTEKRWEKLNFIKFCNSSFIQMVLTSMINVLNFFQSVKCRLCNN